MAHSFQHAIEWRSVYSYRSVWLACAVQHAAGCFATRVKPIQFSNYALLHQQQRTWEDINFYERKKCMRNTMKN